MWRYYPELLATPVPRYTSFPTAAEFTPAVGAQELDAALARTSGDVSLYVHIPYCEKICWYCGCNTGASNRRARLESYLDALTGEIRLVAQRLGRGARVRRIAFGGGSPNALSPVEFVRLVTTLTESFTLERPIWSIELDPRSLDERWKDVLSHVGVTRASLGVQTFSPKLQKAIGRLQPDDLVRRCVDMLRAAGVTSLNFDMMYGLPSQTREDLHESLAQAVAWGADRIALFGYAHVPHLLPRQRRIDASALPDQSERFAMASEGYQQLLATDYVQVGFDHFAKRQDCLAEATLAGRLRRNFQGFTEDQAPVLIGLGASAISSFPDLLVQNEKNAGPYRMLVSQGRLTGALGIKRDEAVRAQGDIITELLCQGKAVIGTVRATQQAEALRPFYERNLARIDGGSLTILPDGLPYARTIAALFDPWRRPIVPRDGDGDGQGDSRRFSSAV